jgi:predicted anti-sigma-YlaC factor YlaD
MEPTPNPYTPEGESRMFGLLAKGLRHPSRRRRKAFRFLAWWALGSVVVVALAILVFG